MKSDFLTKRVLPIALVILALSVCSLTAFAVGEEGESQPEPEPIVTEAVTDAPPEPVTDVPTEPVYTDPPVVTEEPQTEYIPPETEAEPTTEYAAPVTDEPYYNEPTDAPVQNVETLPQSGTEFQAPTIQKTISAKKYSTNYTAGIVSWICVGLGIIAIAVVMISTKVGARRRAR